MKDRRLFLTIAGYALGAVGFMWSYDRVLTGREVSIFPIILLSIGFLTGMWRAFTDD